MICFKDKTFCGSDCVNTECHRLFTPELRAQAHDWAAGFGLDYAPIAWSDFSGECSEYKEPSELDQGLIPSPRLSPCATKYICDKCYRHWLIGDDPKCPECLAKWENIEYKAPTEEGA